MRARNIKPGFYSNEDLAECSMAARLLAPGLWMLADRDGRLEDRPKRIKGEIFRFDNIDVEPLLAELEAYKHIVRYQISDVNYIQILRFKEHQSPHYSEKESIIPHIPQNYSGKLLSLSNNIPQPQPPDSLNPDSLNPEEGIVGLATDPPAVKTDFPKIISVWNEILGDVCPRIQRLTDQRKRLIASRMIDSFGKEISQWQDYCKTIRGSPFCSGENDRGWRANIDWALKPQTVAKVLEGLYAANDKPLQASPTRTDLAIEEARKRYADAS